MQTLRRFWFYACLTLFFIRDNIFICSVPVFGVKPTDTRIEALQNWLHNAGYELELIPGAGYGGAYVDHIRKRVSLDSHKTLDWQIVALAHECGHILDRQRRGLFCVYKAGYCSYYLSRCSGSDWLHVTKSEYVAWELGELLLENLNISKPALWDINKKVSLATYSRKTYENLY